MILDVVTVLCACAVIVGSFLYARFMLKSKFPHFFNLKKHAYAVCITVIVITILHQFNILSYDLGLTIDQHAMMDYVLVVGSLLVIGFLRKAKYAKPSAMQGIYVKDGENPFEVLFPQWFDDREIFLDLTDLPSFEFFDPLKELLRF